jgi:hypothetical protein
MIRESRSRHCFGFLRCLIMHTSKRLGVESSSFVRMKVIVICAIGGTGSQSCQASDCRVAGSRCSPGRLPHLRSDWAYESTRQVSSRQRLDILSINLSQLITHDDTCAHESTPHSGSVSVSGKHPTFRFSFSFRKAPHIQVQFQFQESTPHSGSVSVSDSG